jgi:hypothetical protein
MFHAARRLVVLLAVLALVGCTPTAQSSGQDAKTYGQVLPATFCDSLDFAPMVTAVDAGPIFGGPDPLYDHSGTENQWYSCSVATQQREGPDQYHYVAVEIRVDLFGRVETGRTSFDTALAQLQAPDDIAADSVQRAVKEIRPDAYRIYILDGNLMVTAIVVDQQHRAIAPAAEPALIELARTALAAVRRLATSA